MIPHPELFTRAVPAADLTSQANTAQDESLAPGEKKPPLLSAQNLQHFLRLGVEELMLYKTSFE